MGRDRYLVTFTITSFQVTLAFANKEYNLKQFKVYNLIKNTET